MVESDATIYVTWPQTTGGAVASDISNFTSGVAANFIISGFYFTA
jgi:hypothetical protein